MSAINRFLNTTALCLVSFYVAGQITRNNPSAQADRDTGITKQLSIKKFHPDPKIATRLALIPGVGQLYNHDYWKLPVVYLSLGGGIFAYHLNTLKYHDFLSAYKSFYDLTTGELAKGVTADTRKTVRIRNMFNTSSRYDAAYLDQIRRQKNYWRRFRNVSVLTTGAIFILTIIEANVAAHLKTFDISEDLTLNIFPKLYHPVDNSSTIELQLVLSFH